MHKKYILTFIKLVHTIDRFQRKKKTRITEVNWLVNVKCRKRVRPRALRSRRVCEVTEHVKKQIDILRRDKMSNGRKKKRKLSVVLRSEHVSRVAEYNIYVVTRKTRGLWGTSQVQTAVTTRAPPPPGDII